VLTAVTNENSSGLLVFGSFSDVGLKDQYTLYEIPLFLLLGVMGGALGAAFNMLNRMISVRRARIYGGHTATNSKFKRFLECAAVSLMVSGLAFMVS
jgi:chloride channel 7